MNLSNSISLTFFLHFISSCYFIINVCCLPPMLLICRLSHVNATKILQFLPFAFIHIWFGHNRMTTYAYILQIHHHRRYGYVIESYICWTKFDVQSDNILHFLVIFIRYHQYILCVINDLLVVPNKLVHQ